MLSAVQILFSLHAVPAGELQEFEANQKAKLDSDVERIGLMAAIHMVCTRYFSLRGHHSLCVMVDICDIPVVWGGASKISFRFQD